MVCEKQVAFGSQGCHGKEKAFIWALGSGRLARGPGVPADKNSVQRLVMAPPLSPGHKPLTIHPAPRWLWFFWKEVEKKLEEEANAEEQQSDV